ncbi:MAG: hypothetical protein ACRD50_02760 [Candidatus Acidiferrales bacterium]
MALASALEVVVVVFSFRRPHLFRYTPLAACMLAFFLMDAGRLFVLQKYGWSSPQYLYFYYYSDALATIALYFGIMCLYKMVFAEMGASRYIQGAAVMLLFLTAAFSYKVIHQQQGHLTSRFVVELSQNLYFVGVVLTYLLWGAVLKLRETRARLVQLILGLGVYFSAYAAYYAFRNLFPNVEGLHKFVPQFLGLILPLGWAYTFAKVPEDMRLQPSRLAVRTR